MIYSTAPKTKVYFTKVKIVSNDSKFIKQKAYKAGIKIYPVCTQTLALKIPPLDRTLIIDVTIK